MNKILLKKFKAFEGEIVIPVDGKHLLLYGENGAGKSSIYQALKIIFFNQQLEAFVSDQSFSLEEMEQRKNDFWSSYNNRITNQSFEIHVNDIDYLQFDITSYQAYMVSMDELTVGNNLNLLELIGRFYFPITDIRTFCASYHGQIQEGVNATLQEFKESVQIVIDEEDDFNVKIIDPQKNLERKVEIKRYFNEAKLNLITLLILLNTIYLSKRNDKTNILVLDDFITSLDAANRAFIVRYIFEKFVDFTLFIFTHNVSFYNLIIYLVKENDPDAVNWVFGNLYEINNLHKLYVKNEIEEVKDLKKSFEQLNKGDFAELESFGNRMRKKFEVLLYELSKILMIGAVEDSNKIIERISKGKPVYFNNNRDALELIDDIDSILGDNNQNNLSGRIQQKINYFKQDLSVFRSIIADLKLYQKVTMHPMSHSTIGMVTFTTKEIEKSLDLLDKMETYLKRFVGENVAAV